MSAQANGQRFLLAICFTGNAIATVPSVTVRESGRQ
jgi:hypothetical protein